MGDRIEVTGEHLSATRPAKWAMSTMNEAPTSWAISARWRNWGSAGRPSIRYQHQRTELLGLHSQGAVVEESGGGIEPRSWPGRKVSPICWPEPVGEMPAGVERHPHHALGVQVVTQPVPAHRVEVIDMAHAGLVQGGLLDPMSQNGPVGDQVGVDSRVRLDVGVLGAERVPWRVRQPGSRSGRPSRTRRRAMARVPSAYLSDSQLPMANSTPARRSSPKR